MMKKFILIFVFLISVFAFSQEQKPDTTKSKSQLKNRDTLYFWKGKRISSKSLDDSLDAYFIKYVDSVKKVKKSSTLK